MTPDRDPSAEGLGLSRRPDPARSSISGASGDLTQARKLLPAVYALAYRRLLPERFAIVGVARSEQTQRQFVTAMRNHVKQYARDPYRADARPDRAERPLRRDRLRERGRRGQGRTALDELDRTIGTAGNRLGTTRRSRPSRSTR